MKAIEKLLCISTSILMLCTSTCFAASWSGRNLITIEAPQAIDIAVNGDFAVDTFTSGTQPYLMQGYRGNGGSYAFTNNIKGYQLDSTGKYPTYPVETIDDEHGNSMKIVPNKTPTTQIINDVRYSFGLFHMADDESG